MLALKDVDDAVYAQNVGFEDAFYIFIEIQLQTLHRSVRRTMESRLILLSSQNLPFPIVLVLMKTGPLTLTLVSLIILIWFGYEDLWYELNELILISL